MFRQFLSISISTNKAVYDGGQDIRFVNSIFLLLIFFFIISAFSVYLLKF